MDSLTQLKEQIASYDESYYNNGISLIPDYEYDLLKLQYEAASGVSHIGSDKQGKLRQVAHIMKLLSLKNAHSVAELNLFSQTTLVNPEDMTAMPKFHGMTLELVYIDGKLDQAITRGKDNIGDDVTHNLGVVKNLQTKIPFTGKVSIVGEMLAYWEDFNKWNAKQAAKGDKLFAHPLNMTVSLMKRTKAETLGKWLTFMPFDTSLEYVTTTQLAEIMEILNYNFKIFPVEFTDTFVSNTKAVLAEYPFPTDGFVVRVANQATYQNLGFTSTHPRGAVAYKFDEIKATSKLEGVSWSVGGSGKVTPTAEFAVVKLLGTDVRRATLHNIVRFREMRPQVGDSVVVIKSKEIIPAISEIIHGTNTAEILPEITKCPACESTLVQQDSDLFCINDDCSGKKLRKLVRFCSRRGFNINIDEAGLSKLLDMGLKDYSELFILNTEAVMQLDGYGYASAQKLKQSTIKAKNIQLKNFIYSLSIPKIGYSNAVTLAEYCGNLETFLAYSYDDFLAIPDIGPTLATSLSNFVTNKDNLEAIRSLVAYGIDIRNDKNGRYTGQIFVITGSFPMPRPDIQELIEDQGGIIKSTVTTSTSYVLVGEHPGKNAEKAKNLSIPIITDLNVIK